MVRWIEMRFIEQVFQTAYVVQMGVSDKNRRRQFLMLKEYTLLSLWLLVKII